MDENKLNYEGLEELMGKIEESMNLSDEKANNIRNKRDELYSEFNTLRIAEGSEELKQMEDDKIEFDNMTADALIYALKQIPELKENEEKAYQEMLLDMLEKNKEIDEKLENMKARGLTEEQLQWAEKSATEAKEKLSVQKQELEGTHFHKMAKLDEFQRSIMDYGIKLSIEDKLKEATLEQSNGDIGKVEEKEEEKAEEEAEKKEEEKTEEEAEKKEEEKAEKSARIVDAAMRAAEVARINDMGKIVKKVSKETEKMQAPATKADTVKTVETKADEAKETPKQKTEKVEEEKKKNGKDEKIKVVFSARGGDYSLYSGDSGEEIEFEDDILGNLDDFNRDINKSGNVDIYVYTILQQYDKSNNTNKAESYVEKVNQIGKSKKDRMNDMKQIGLDIEYDLRGLYSKSAELSRQDRMEILEIANNASKKGIATVKKGLRVRIGEFFDKIATRHENKAFNKQKNVKAIEGSKDDREEGNDLSKVIDKMDKAFKDRMDNQQKGPAILKNNPELLSGKSLEEQKQFAQDAQSKEAFSDKDKDNENVL